MINSLKDIIAPLSEEEFLSSYWTRSFTHFPGTPGRFEGLYSWEHLNHVLEEHRLIPGRLRLSRNAKPIETTQYLYGPGDYRLRSTEFVKQLANGATLILNHADETYSPLRDLASTLERFFRATVVVNLYAGWKTDPGFTMHFDDQDTFILQVYGRKQWQVWTPTRQHPLRPDIEPVPKPEGTPCWEGILNDGEALFMPRGWWHVAYPLNEPCLHLTVSIVSHTGVDFLKWVAEQMRVSVDVRNNLPVHGSQAEQDSYLDTLRQQIEQLLVPGILEKFLSSWEARRLQRPDFILPFLGADTSLAAASKELLYQQ
jgi:ribosomal protein L16 Arg81 hydroxylase